MRFGRPSSYTRPVTRVLLVDPQFPDPGIIGEAAALLRAGRLVAFPTETVYGLGANALDRAAVLAIYAAKERTADDPLIVHIATMPELDGVATSVPPAALALAKRFWPGGLTIVLPRGPAIAPEVSGGGGTVAVRMPSHPVARALISAAGVPIAAPSANRFMRTSATTAAHVLEDLDGRIDLVLDGGPATAGIESTVVSFDEAARLIRILREGAVTVEALREAAPEGWSVVSGPPGTAAEGSPGRMEKHYAPRKPLTYVRDPDGREALLALVREAVSTGSTPGVVACADDAADLAALGAIVETVGQRDDVETVARQLFAAMRALDRSAADMLFARQFAAGGLGRAIDDRLTRAATKVIEFPEG